MNEMTDKADSYSASNDLVAGYISTNLPITSWANIYAGARIEKNNQQLNSFKRDGSSTTPISIKRDTMNIFPSINATINLSKNMLIRLAGGETVNRPEFREISTFAFYSFEEKTFMFGNENLKNSYITNYDARVEWYPTTEEIVSIGNTLPMMSSSGYPMNGLILSIDEENVVMDFNHPLAGENLYFVGNRWGKK